MSSALLRADLKAELQELDQRYGQSVKKVSRKAQGKRFKKDPKVDELAKTLQASASSQKELDKRAVQANVKKLKELSAQSSSLKKVSLQPIYNQIISSKRSFEPKGRTLLKKKSAVKKAAKAETSVFTEEDFEDFRKSYFVNSSTIGQKAKKAKKGDDLD